MNKQEAINRIKYSSKQEKAIFKIELEECLIHLKTKGMPIAFKFGIFDGYIPGGYLIKSIDECEELIQYCI